MTLKFGDYVKQRSEAARWLFARRNASQFWRWPVLTARNTTDATALKLSDATAWNVFTDLTQRGLLVTFVHPDGSDAYKLDLGKESEWRAVAKPPGFFRSYVFPVIGWLFNKGWGIIVFLLGAVAQGWIRSLFSTQP